MLAFAGTIPGIQVFPGNQRLCPLNMNLKYGKLDKQILPNVQYEHQEWILRVNNYTQSKSVL